jgi:lipopolysaccharide export system protein LptA
LLATPITLFALPDDRNQPIQLEADRAQLDQKTGISVYQGNVVITQGSMRLTADKVTIYLQNGNFQRMEAIGKLVTLRYKPAVNTEEINGVSKRVEYNAVTAQMVMTTDAKITQGQDVFSGDRIEYDLKEDLVKAQGTAEGGRIQFILQPKTKNK